MTKNFPSSVPYCGLYFCKLLQLYTFDIMAPPREPTRAQLSSKLAYQRHTPSFLLKLQNRMNGIPDEEEDDDDEFEHVGSGRPAIPKRPAIPERPKDDPGSADEDDGDEKPQVVVLKAGKHLTEREAENVRRKEKGLPPLPEPEASDNTTTTASNNAPQSSSKETSSSSSSKSLSGSQGLSFSSSKSSTIKSNNKRKAVGQLDQLKDGIMEACSDDKGAKSKSSQKGSASVKKAKKSNKTVKTLLSFGDDT